MNINNVEREKRLVIVLERCMVPTNNNNGACGR